MAMGILCGTALAGKMLGLHNAMGTSRGGPSAGKMLGLHNGNGHVMWSLAFPPGQAPQQLFLWRSSHDLQRAPQVLALHSSETTSSYSIVDAHTGKEVSSGIVDISVSQVMCTSVSRGDSQQM